MYLIFVIIPIYLVSRAAGIERNLLLLPQEILETYSTFLAAKKQL